MSSYQYDVIIVGAGPAGCILSYLLARSGIKVLLIERDASFIREFRGPAYQPCIVDYFNQMGILDEVLTVDHSTVREFEIKQTNKTLFSLDLGILPPPYNYTVAMEQGPLLRKLIQLCTEFPNLTFLGNTAVEDLITTNGMVSGVKVTIDGQEKEIASRLVVGADGRFSTVRELAEIPLKKANQQFDVVWFDYPDPTDTQYDLGIEITPDGIVVCIPQEKGHLRVGWVLEKGGYKQLQKEGIKKFRDSIISVKPQLEKNLTEALQSFDQCSYLDVKIACARDWAKDGLLLIGDAAHIASPVGAQGNKLAIQDAIAAHPAIIKALHQHDGTVRSYQLTDYVSARKKEAKKIFRWQRILGKAILGIRNPVMDKIRQFLFPIFRKTIAPKLIKIIGFGFQPVSVAQNLFAFQSDYGKHHRYYLLPVKKVIQETEQAHSFYLEVPEEVKNYFLYKPGQFITLRILDKGQLHKRCYSLSSIPEDKDLRITIKRVEEGLISNDMIDSVHEGMELLVLPPAGQFVATPGAKHYCMIAGGSGITPIFSLIRSLLKDPDVASICFIDVNHDTKAIIFHEKLNELQQQNSDRLQVIHNTTTESGRLTEAKLEEMLKPTYQATQFYVCGPKGLHDMTLNVLNKLKVPASSIHIERFTSLAEPFETVHGGEEESPLIVGETPDSGKGEEKTVDIVLKGNTYTIRCRPDESILDAALRQGIDAPFSCREGICSTCLAHLESGKVVMDRHQALTETDAQSKKVLTCQARPLTKRCSVEYP